MKRKPVAKDQRDRWPSEGRRLLGLALEAAHRAGRTNAEIAAEIGITKRMLDSLAQGTRRPSLDVAADLEDRLLIRASSWAQAQTKNDTPSVTASRYENKKPHEAA